MRFTINKASDPFYYQGPPSVTAYNANPEGLRVEYEVRIKSLEDLILLNDNEGPIMIDKGHITIWDLEIEL